MAKKRKPEAEKQRLPQMDTDTHQGDIPMHQPELQEPDTVPLSEPHYSSLPVGALLHQRRYEIKQVISSGRKINIYLAEEDLEQRVCPSCGEDRNRSTDQFCSGCGVELVNVPVTRPLYLVKESSDLQEQRPKHTLPHWFPPAVFQHKKVHIPQ